MVPSTLDTYLKSHLMDPARLRSDDFAGFMRARQRLPLRLIEQATGQPTEGDGTADAETDDETVEASLTMTAA